MADLLTMGSLAYAGFAAMCLATERGRRQAALPAAVPTHFLRLAGWLLLATSTIPLLLAPRLPIAMVAWLGLLMVAAAPLTFGMAYAPRLAMLVGPGAALLAALFLWQLG